MDCCICTAEQSQPTHLVDGAIEAIIADPKAVANFMQDPRVMQATMVLTGATERLLVDEADLHKAERMGDIPRRDVLQLADKVQCHGGL